jgi:hypothetical protein
MFIPDPGSDFFPSRIRIKEFKYFNPKKWFQSFRKYDPGCSSRIRIRTSTHPGSATLEEALLWKHLSTTCEF